MNKLDTSVQKKVKRMK